MKCLLCAHNWTPIDEVHVWSFSFVLPSSVGQWGGGDEQISNLNHLLELPCENETGQTTFLNLAIFHAIKGKEAQTAATLLGH